MKLVAIGPGMLSRPRYFGSIDELRAYLWGKPAADYEVFVQVPITADLDESVCRIWAAVTAGGRERDQSG